MKIAVINGFMHLHSMDVTFSLEDLISGNYLDKCYPKLNFEITFEVIQGEHKDDKKGSGREYYITENSELIYKKYDLQVGDLWMYHPCYLNCTDSEVTGKIYVKEHEVEEGKKLLIKAFKEQLNYKKRKLNMLFNAIEEHEKELTS